MKQYYLPKVWPGENTSWSDQDIAQLIALEKDYLKSIRNRPKWRYVRLASLNKFINENKEFDRIFKKVAAIRNIKVSTYQLPEFIAKEIIIMLLQNLVFSIEDLKTLILKNEDLIYEIALSKKGNKAIALYKGGIILDALLFSPLIKPVAK